MGSNIKFEEELILTKILLHTTIKYSFKTKLV